MLLPDGFFDFAIRDPGPQERWAAFGFARTPMTAITHHSQEGHSTMVSVPSTGYNPMRDPARAPTAWHWTVVRRDHGWAQDGQMLQHYPVWARLQHGNEANILGPGGESEDGGVAEPTVRLTEAQEETWLLIHQDMRDFTGLPYERVPGSQTGLVEHREMTRPPGLTQCPSNLYDNLWTRIAGGGFSVDDKARLTRLEGLIAANGISKDLSKPLELIFGEEALEYADSKKWSAFLGLFNNQTKAAEAWNIGKAAAQAVAEHKALHPGGVAGPHRHRGGETGDVV